MFLNYSLVVLLVLSFVLCFYIEIKYLSPTVIFWIGLIGIFLIPHLVYSLFLKSVNLETLIKTTIFVSLFNYLYFFSKIILIKILKKKKYDWTFENLYNNKNERINRLLTFMYFLGLLVWIMGLLLAGFNPVSSSWNDTLKVNSFLSQIGNILIFAASGIILYNYLTNNPRVLIFVVALNLVCILLLRARILLISLIIPFIILILYKNNRINFKFRFVLLILTFTFSLFLLQAFRWSGGIADFNLKKIPLYVSSSIKNITGKSGEFHLVTEFYTIVENNNESKYFGEGRTYWRLALFWLPRSLLPDNLKFIKPRDFAIDIYNLVYKTPDNTRGTTHPTFYGDLFANFGWFGIGMAVFWVLVTEYFDQMFKRNKAKLVFLLGNIATFYVMIARGAIYNGSFIMLLTLIIVSILFFRYKYGKLNLF
jgi:hypothetical protein